MTGRGFMAWLGAVAVVACTRLPPPPDLVTLQPSRVIDTVTTPVTVLGANFHARIDGDFENPDAAVVYAELCEVVQEVIDNLQTESRTLPVPRTRPMQEVV